MKIYFIDNWEMVLNRIYRGPRLQPGERLAMFYILN